jgi:hypothetical protein
VVDQQCTANIYLHEVLHRYYSVSGLVSSSDQVFSASGCPLPWAVLSTPRSSALQHRSSFKTAGIRVASDGIHHARRNISTDTASIENSKYD